MVESAMNKLLIALLLFASLSSMANEGVYPPADERLKHLTKSQLKLHYDYIRPFSEYRDPKLEAYVKKVGERILAESGHAGKQYAFIIRDNPLPGASVLGTPVVYIDRGLFAALNSEAEFAGVMGHEIGHNVGRHVARSKRKAITNNVIATLVGIMAGSGNVGNAIATQNQVNFFEYRREHELEADQLGAEYMHKAGYEPSGLIYGLSQVFDVSKYISGYGVDKVSHHSLRASHPREDKRLRKVIEAAGELPPGESILGRDEFRAAVDGLIFGPNPAKQTPPGARRYTNESLGITFLYPDDWQLSVKGSQVILKDPDKTVQLGLTIEKTKDKQKSSEELFKAKYPDAVNLEKIHQNSERDLGTLGAQPARRLALVNVARNTFHFLGIAKNNVVTPEQDKIFVGIIRSFRRMTPKDRVSDMVTRIYYERLAPGENFASLAASSKGFKGEDIETALRVLNGYYPKGEAEPGTWIKKLRREKIDK